MFGDFECNRCGSEEVEGDWASCPHTVVKRDVKCLKCNHTWSTFKCNKCDITSRGNHFDRCPSCGKKWNW